MSGTGISGGTGTAPMVPPGAYQVSAVYGAMAKATRMLAQVGIDKSSENASQGFNFRGIDAVLGALSKVLVECGLFVLPHVRETRTETLTINGKPRFKTVVVVNFQITSTADGSAVLSSFAGEALDTQDKATSKALSMAYKYFAFQTFCIPLDGVLDDADAHSPMMESEPAAEQPAPKKRAARKAEPEAVTETEPEPLPAPASEDTQSAELLAALSAVGPGCTDTLAQLRAQLLGYRGTQVFADLKVAYKAAQARVESK